MKSIELNKVFLSSSASQIRAEIKNFISRLQFICFPRFLTTDLIDGTFIKCVVLEFLLNILLVYLRSISNG